MTEEGRLYQIAKVCHEANRAYCESIGDRSQLDWEHSPAWQKKSAIDGVKFHLDNDTTPEGSHINWMRDKKADGWVYGPEKDPAMRTHPCLIPFDQLPLEQQMKDRIFHAIVGAFKNVQ